MNNTVTNENTKVLKSNNATYDYCDTGDQSLVNNVTTGGHDFDPLATVFAKQSTESCVCLKEVGHITTHNKLISNHIVKGIGQNHTNSDSFILDTRDIPDNHVRENLLSGHNDQNYCYNNIVTSLENNINNTKSEYGSGATISIPSC